METEVENQKIETTRKIVERSAAYPAKTIEESIKFVSEFYKNFRAAFAKRDDIIKAIENTTPRDLASASYYTILLRDKDNYQITDLYKRITNPVLPGEINISLLKAFASPKLNSELIEKFDAGELPTELKFHLIRFFKITEDAAPLAAEVFIKNAKYCGVLNEHNVLNYKQTLLKLNAPNYKFFESKSENTETLNGESKLDLENNIPDTPATTLTGDLKKQTLLLEEMVNKEEVKIRLTGRRFAQLIYPGDLTKTDVAILKKQIEQLELIAE